MKSIKTSSIVLLILFVNLSKLHAADRTKPLIINHSCTDITQVPQSRIELAKDSLHIAYGHTSHGSQITDGMSGLINFANNGGKGLNLPENIFAWNNGGTDGALDLHDYAMGGDVGYYPAWVNNTRNYLGEPNQAGRGSKNPDVNVIMWSWCGQVDDKYVAGTLYSEYLEPMDQLESDYPAITFIYMTGHTDIWHNADIKAANQTIRDYCISNNKVLYDFADIEHYDPDGTFFEYVTDDCSYYTESIVLAGNWATEWQDSHTEGVDWYNCSSAHSQPLNANQKAYAAWWMWSCLTGWNTTIDMSTNNRKIFPQNIKLFQNYPNPFNPKTIISYQLPTSSNVELSIYNLLSQKVATLVNKKQPAGNYTVQWDGSGFAGGVYYYRINAGDFHQVKKMVLLK